MRRLHLERRVFTSRHPEATQGHTFPGDPCASADCTGHMVVYSTIRKPEAGVVIRYMECSNCGGKPENNKWTENLFA